MIDRLKDHTFPQFQGLVLKNLKFIEDKEKGFIKEFFRKSLPNNLPSLFINYRSISPFGNLDHYIGEFKHAMTKATEEVCITDLHINSKTLETIFKACRKVKKLEIVFCDIATLDHPLDFGMDLEYEIQTLCLWGTAWRDNPKKLNSEKAKTLAEGIKQIPSLWSSLTEIHIWKQLFPLEEFESIFEGLQDVRKGDFSCSTVQKLN